MTCKPEGGGKAAAFNRGKAAYQKMIETLRKQSREEYDKRLNRLRAEIVQKRQEISKLYREAEAANNVKEMERLKKWYRKLSDTNIKRLMEQMAAFKGWPENGRVDNGQGWGDNKERGPEGAGDVFKSTPELENHIQYVDPSVPRNRGIGGAHNSEEFFKNDVKVVTAVPIKDIPGVTYYQYNMPKLGKDGWPVGEYGIRIFEKTVYDPSVISDSEYMRRGLEAANDAYKRNRSLGNYWEGYDSFGVKWVGYGRNGKPTSFFPDIPKQ